MTTSTAALQVQFASTAPGWKAALVGGFAAGLFDFVAACVASGKGPMFIGQVIGSGLLGKSSYQGGVGSAVLGTAAHFGILLAVAAIYVAASRRMEFLCRQPILCGLVLGVIVYSVMNAIVVPFSNAGMGRDPDQARRLVQIGIHMLFVGLPIALATARIR